MDAWVKALVGVIVTAALAIFIFETYKASKFTSLVQEGSTLEQFVQIRATQERVEKIPILCENLNDDDFLEYEFENKYRDEFGGIFANDEFLFDKVCLMCGALVAIRAEEEAGGNVRDVVEDINEDYDAVYGVKFDVDEVMSILEEYEDNEELKMYYLQELMKEEIDRSMGTG